jgi:hypothetical protein
MMDTFPFFWKRLPYLQQDRPATDGVAHLGERTIEVPIAREFIAAVAASGRMGDLVEVGAVMPYYQTDPVTWPVVDPYDPYRHSIREDAADVDYRGRIVLSISTIEHIGLCEYGNTAPAPRKAIMVFGSIVRHAAAYLVSWPVGHNALLDDHARQTMYPRFVYRQCSPDNRWEQIAERWDFEYGDPYPYGNGVVFFAGANA